MKLQPQVDLLYKKLDAELDNFNKGERFLSLNQIMKKYHANLRVVNGALKQLEDNGLIFRKRYIGIFSNISRNKKIPTLLLSIPDYPSDELSGFVRELQEYLGKNPVFRLNIYRYLESEARCVLPFNRADIVLFFGDGLPYSPGELKTLAESGKPVVFTSDEFPGHSFSYINFDSIAGGMTACDYLLKQGCRKLLAIHTEPRCRGITERISAFENYAKLHQVSCEKLECGTNFFESSSYNSREMMSLFLAQNSCDFDGIFVDCHTSLGSILKALKQNCPERAEKVKIVTFCGFGFPLEEHLPQVAMVSFCIGDFINVLFKSLQKLCKKEIPRFSIRMPMKIREN